MTIKTEKSHSINLFEIERFIKEEFNMNCDLAYMNTLTNDSSHGFRVKKGKKLTTQEAASELQILSKKEDSLRNVLKVLCDYEVIPEGKVYVDVSW